MISGLVGLLIAIIVIALVAGLLVFLVRSAPFIAAPFKTWLEWAIIAIAILCIILQALPLIGVSVAAGVAG